MKRREGGEKEDEKEDEKKGEKEDEKKDEKEDEKNDSGAKCEGSACAAASCEGRASAIDDALFSACSDPADTPTGNINPDLMKFLRFMNNLHFLIHPIVCLSFQKNPFCQIIPITTPLVKECYN